MSRADRGPGSRALLRALILSIAAAALPVAGAFLFPATLADYEALMWLLLLVPAFLWAFERGWSGVATTLALGMAALSVTYAIAESAGRTIPDLLFAVVAAYVGISLAIGVFGERVTRLKLAEAAEIQALQDPLTGLPNRLHAETHLVMEYAAALRGQPLAVVLFEMDHLRDYSIRLGRAAGDAALKRFSELLMQRTRRVDLSARYGQDGFMSILSGCEEEGAVIFAARVQEQLRGTDGNGLMPTVSVGIACYRGTMKAPGELLKAAEEALAAAKQDGRDRVRIHGRTLAELGQADGLTYDWKVTDTPVVRRRDQTLEAIERQTVRSLETVQITHDFNNLLALIHGHAELLLDGDDVHEEMRTGLLEIRDAAERAAALTRQLATES